MSIDSGRRHWESLMAGFQNPPNAESVYCELLARYAESHRAYHNLAHIVAMLDELERINRHAPEVALAVWFHDAIYEPIAKDNEQQSAALAVKAIESMGLAKEIGSRVSQLIEATTHTDSPLDEPARLLVDLDLMILGSPDDEFNRYEEAIRREYAWVPDSTYRAARVRILQSFLDRPSIYNTDMFVDRFDAAARRNLSRSIAVLQRGA